MISLISSLLSALANDFILLLLNPLGLFMVMMIVLYLEKTVISSLKYDALYNGAIRLKIKDNN